MTVLITAMPVEGRPAGGPAYAASALARGLVARGEEIEIWSNRDARPDRALGGRIKRMWDYGAAWWQLSIALAKRRPSLVHFQHSLFLYAGGGLGAFLSLLPVLTCKLLGIPLVATVHDLPAREQITPAYVRNHRYRYPPFAVKFALRILFGVVSRCSDRLFVHHEAFRKVLHRDYNCPRAKIHVIPIRVVLPDNEDLEAAARGVSRSLYGLPPDEFVVGFLGYAAPYKGLEILLDAARSALTSSPGMTFLIGAGPQPSRTGDREYAAYYDSLKRRADALTNVRWSGFVEEESLRAFFDSCDVVALPYVSVVGASGPLWLCSQHGTPALISTVIAEAIGQMRDVAFSLNGASLEAVLRRFRADAAFRAEIAARCEHLARADDASDPHELTALVYASVKS